MGLNRFVHKGSAAAGRDSPDSARRGHSIGRSSITNEVNDDIEFFASRICRGTYDGTVT